VIARSTLKREREKKNSSLSSLSKKNALSSTSSSFFSVRRGADESWAVDAMVWGEKSCGVEASNDDDALAFSLSRGVDGARVENKKMGKGGRMPLQKNFELKRGNRRSASDFSFFPPHLQILTGRRTRAPLFLYDGGHSAVSFTARSARTKLASECQTSSNVVERRRRLHSDTRHASSRRLCALCILQRYLLDTLYAAMQKEGSSKLCSLFEATHIRIRMSQNY